MAEKKDKSQSLVLLKLGGSLITDKSQPRSLRQETLQRLAEEIATARQQIPSLQLIMPVVSLPPSASVTAQEGAVARWDLGPLKSALEVGLVPVIYGDVIFDLQRGGTILSTEDLFSHLVTQLHPGRMLLAGIEPGVWQDFPDRSEIIPKITPKNYQEILHVLSGSAETDVTGGMESKVDQAVALINKFPGLEILIFSGDEPGNLQNVLLGASRGTVICSE
jgi:isopentenyl phosphate kinase